MSSSKHFSLITDKKSYEQLSASSLQLLEEFNVEKVVFIDEKEITDTFSKDTFVLVYLCDKAVKKVIPRLKESGCVMGFLPHEESPALTNGFHLKKSFNKILKEVCTSDKVVETDLLYCNDKPVLSTVVIGDIMKYITSKNRTSWVKGIKGFFKFIKGLKKIRAKLYTIKSDDKEEIEVAATDILIVQHNKNNIVSRVLMENSFANDGMFHTLIFAPRSLLQLISALLIKLFIGNFQKNTSFNFLGHIKTNEIKIKGDPEAKYSVDNMLYHGIDLTLTIKPGLKIIPTSQLKYAEGDYQNKKKYQIDKLPKGEARKQIITQTLPWIQFASTEEYKDLFTTLRENAKPKQTYVVLMILSVILATFGLFSNSSPVIIGAMILAPLMSPIISLSMGVLRQDIALIRTSVITVLIGLGVGYLFAIIITLITPLTDLNMEISSRIKPTIIDLGVAVISGAAGAYAHSKEEVAKTLAGVAIAVALVPPLAVSGIGIGWGNWNVFWGAFLLLLTNLTGMVLAGSLTFLLAGYSPMHLARKGILIFSFIVLALSIPLGYGFFRLVQENRIIQSVNHYEVDTTEIKDVSIVRFKPLTLSVNLVSDKTLSDQEISRIKTEIEDIIGEDIILEIQMSIRK